MIEKALKILYPLFVYWLIYNKERNQIDIARIFGFSDFDVFCKATI